MKCIKIIFSIAFLSSAFATQSAEHTLCESKHCWFGHADNPVVKVQLKSWNNWYTHEDHWTRELEMPGKSGEYSISNCVPILNIAAAPINEWPKEIDRGLEVLISGYDVTPYTYADIIQTPDINAYVMAEQYNKHKDEALSFIDKKRTSLKTVQHKHIKKALELLNKYHALIAEQPAAQWHECTGLIVPLRSVLAITTIISIAATQKR